MSLKSTYLALIAVPLVSMGANATLITVDGTDYDILTLTDTFANNETLLESQVWWGDADLALVFADALNATFVSFAWHDCDDNPDVLDCIFPDIPVQAREAGGGWSGFSKSISVTYAYVNPSSVPEPSTFALFGVGLVCMGLMKRRKPT